MTNTPKGPVFVEILSNYLVSVAEEMTAAMVRSAYSPAIRDRRDCSSALLTPEGDTIAQAADIPIHLGALVGIVGDAVAHYGVQRLRDGDVLLANDPYQGSSTHLNDISAIAPIFLDAQLVAFACVTAHHSDVGGKRPGSESVDAESIFQEGIRLPCLLAFRDGAVVDEVLNLVTLNSRTPKERAGDLRAQIGAVLKGRSRILELGAKYGVSRIQNTVPALLSFTEARFRRQLAQLPDGVFSASEDLDPERMTRDRVCLRVKVSKSGENITVDFTGTTRQIPEGRNLPYAGTLAAVHYAVRSLVDPEMPANSGFFRATSVVAPTGCLINPVPPGAVSTRASTAQHVAGVVFKAVAPSWSDRVVAGCDGRRKVIFSGPDLVNSFFVYHESNAGGLGAHASGDGIDGAVAHLIQILNLPAEALELSYPLAIDRLELITDSGGAGRWRGGAGVRRDYRTLVEPVQCSVVSERSNDGMWGLFGAEPGARGHFVVNPGSPDKQEVDSSQAAYVDLRRNDVMSVQTAGGGGFGPPKERPLELVVRDVKEGRVSVTAARRSYGVRVRKSRDGEWKGRRVGSVKDIKHGQPIDDD